jgi:hypothetical protein
MIERRPFNRLRLVECPLCEADLRSTSPALHLADHAPEDIGKSTKRGDSF